MRSNRKQVFLAVCGSVLLHLLFLTLWALAAARIPTPDSPARPTPPVHLEIVKAEETPLPLAPAPTPIPFLNTTSRDLSDHPPDAPKFESDRDTQAASRLPATGDQPLPTQEGRKVPAFAFDTTAYVAGDTAAPPPPAPPTAPPPPQPAAATPRPHPTAAPTPSHTPVPDDEFALVPPTPTPADTEPPFDPSFRGPASTSPERPTVASRTANASNAAGFQAEQQMTSVTGNIGRQGEANVDSVATPVGRYKTSVVRAIESKWSAYFLSRSDVIALGRLHVRLVVDRGGRVLTPKVLSNSSNEALAAVSLQAIMDAPIPPMPPDTLKMIRGGELSVDLIFDSQ